MLMKNRLTASFLAGCVMLLCSCAGTSVKQTWKSPNGAKGPVGKVAVLAVAERGMIRVGLENRLARQLEQGGEPVIRTHELLALREIKEDKEAAAKRLRDAGAQTVLITRLLSSETQARSVRAGDEHYVPVTTGFSPGLPYGPYDWYGYYTVAFEDMSTIWSSRTRHVYLETSLFDLVDGQRLWSCLTKTVLTDTTDAVAEEERLARLIADALRKDGLVK